MMTAQKRVQTVSAVVPLACSMLALVLVGANILAGVQPEADEGTAAHIWQLLMAIQIPLILVYSVLADWSPRSSTLWLGAQLLGIVAAIMPVFLMGY